MSMLFTDSDVALLSEAAASAVLFSSAGAVASLGAFSTSSFTLARDSVVGVFLRAVPGSGDSLLF